MAETINAVDGLEQRADYPYSCQDKAAENQAGNKFQPLGIRRQEDVLGNIEDEHRDKPGQSGEKMMIRQGIIPAHLVIADDFYERADQEMTDKPGRQQGCEKDCKDDKGIGDRDRDGMRKTCLFKPSDEKIGLFMHYFPPVSIVRSVPGWV